MEGPILMSLYSFIAILLAYWSMTLSLEGWYNKFLNPLKRLVMLLSAILLLIPPTEIVYNTSGYFLNVLGLLILIVFHFVQSEKK